jgi:ribosomal protein S18 acetylase RimI-like enzyme
VELHEKDASVNAFESSGEKSTFESSPAGSPRTGAAAPVNRRGIALFEAAAENLLVHMSIVQRHVRGMSVLDDGELAIIDSGLPCDTFNVVCRSRLAAEIAPGRIAAAIDHFRSAQRPFSWWVGPGDRPDHLEELLQRAGLKALESEAAMTAELRSLVTEFEHAGNLRIERVRTREQLRQLADLCAANWDPPDVHVQRFYEAAAPILLADECPVWLYLGLVGADPVATTEPTEGGGIVGLYTVGTHSAWRRRGIGSAMVLRALLDATALGYQTAVLQAAPAGVGLYEKLGFETTGHYTEYKPG